MMSVGVDSRKSKAEETDTHMGVIIISLRLVAVTVVAAVASYWIYQVLTTYHSQPVSSRVTMKRNHTFTWPKFTLLPVNKFNKCANHTEMEELSLAYNLTLANHS